MTYISKRDHQQEDWLFSILFFLTPAAARRLGEPVFIILMIFCSFSGGNTEGSKINITSKFLGVDLSNCVLHVSLQV